MKNYFLITIALFMVSFGYSQSNVEEIDLIQAAFGMDKKSIVADYVNPADTQKDAFWQIYDAYEIERKELGKQRIVLLQEYAEQYLKMTPDQANTWSVKAMDLQLKTDKLIETYYHKINKISDGIVATQFYQIENYILAMIRMQLLHDIPFVKKPFESNPE